MRTQAKSFEVGETVFDREDETGGQIVELDGGPGDRWVGVRWQVGGATYWVDADTLESTRIVSEAA